MYPAGVEGVTARYLRLASGLRVRVVEAGPTDAAPVVLVPGWGCGAWIFHETILPLASAGFRAIAVELKGHGFSDKPTSRGEYTVESMRDHLIDVLDALEAGSAHLLGHSMGASIAAHVASFAPERVRSVVLVAPVGFAGVRGMGLFRALTPAVAVGLLPFIATKALIRLMLRFVYGSMARASNRDVEEFWAPTRTPGFVHALRNLLHEFGWSEPFPSIGVPWMTIVGTEDLLSTVPDTRRYAGPDGRVRGIVIRGAGHVIFPEVPQIVNAALVNFFRSGTAPYIQ
jgi:pimeloyl-ACP methyl ester carboxylesterase